MKFLALILATIFSMSSLAATESICSVRNSSYEALKFSLDSSTFPTITLFEENATFAVTHARILQFGKEIPSEKCQVSTIINDDSMLMSRWHCTPAFSSDKYFSYVEFTFYKQEKTGHLYFAFTDVKSYGGPERHVFFSCR